MHVVFALLVLLFASRADAQACTVPSAGGMYTSATPLATIVSAINAAGNGAVVCLQNGQTFQYGSSLQFTINKSDANRITVCGATAGSCDGTGTWPVIDYTAGLNSNSHSLFTWANGAGGMTWKFIEFGRTTVATCEHNYAVFGHAVSYTVHDVRWEDVRLRNVEAMMTTGDPPVGTDAATNIDYGRCETYVAGTPRVAHPIYLTQCLGPNGGHINYGSVKNSEFTVWTDGTYGWTNQNALGQGHVIDLAPAANSVVGGFENVVVECSRFIHNNATARGMGDMVRVSHGTNITIRDNLFQAIGNADCMSGNGGGGIGFVPHESATWVNIDTAVVERNIFKMGHCFNNGVSNSRASELTIKNNLFDMTDLDGVINNYYGTAINIQPNTVNSTNAPNNAAIVNNTFISPSNYPDSFPYDLVRFCTTASSCGTGHSFINNLIVDYDNDVLTLLAGVTCSNFGVNGVNIATNWVYTPNKVGPGLPDCSASLPAGTNNNGFYPANSNFHLLADADPELVDFSGKNFHITALSNPYGIGSTVGGVTPTRDIEDSLRPSPLSIGAYDVPGVAPTDDVDVVTPNGGESWSAGETRNITWTSVGSWANVAIAYSTTGCAGSFTNITASTPNDGSYSWTVANPGSTSTNVCVRVRDAADATPTDTSDAVFSILVSVAATITVTSPNGGETLGAGQVETISWLNGGGTPPSAVRIRFSPNGCGGTFTNVYASTENDGIATWIPSTNTTNGCLEISDAADSSPIDKSDAVFTVEDEPAPPIVSGVCTE